jgi:hypothetical protein
LLQRAKQAAQAAGLMLPALPTAIPAVARGVEDAEHAALPPISDLLRDAPDFVGLANTVAELRHRGTECLARKRFADCSADLLDAVLKHARALDQQAATQRSETEERERMTEVRRVFIIASIEFIKDPGTQQERFQRVQFSYLEIEAYKKLLESVRDNSTAKAFANYNVFNKNDTHIGSITVDGFTLRTLQTSGNIFLKE